MRSIFRPPLLWLTLFLAARFVLLAYLIIYGPLSLSPDEAQYWTWSKALSFGYYSKPPGIAWQIFFTSSLFGDTEWGVRSSALIIGTFMPYAIYMLARSCGYDRKISIISGFTFALIPLGVIGSILAITDGGMLLFWTLACAYFIRASVNDLPLNPLPLGILLALGALFKWPIYILAATLFLWSLFFERRYLLTTTLAALISLVGLLPSVLWNLDHNFVTFRHVLSSLGTGGVEEAAIGTPNIIEFIGAQFGLVSPLFYIIFWVGYFRFVRDTDESDKSSLFLFFVSSTFLLPLIMAFFTKVQANWGDYAYPTAIVFTVQFLMLRCRFGLFWWGLSSLFSVACLVLLFVYFDEIPYRKNPFKNTLGWRHIGEVLEKKGFDPQKDYLVADSYQNASLLSFYSPSQTRAYFLNFKGRRLNQFSFWSPLKDDPRRQGFFFTQEETHKIKDQSRWRGNDQRLLVPYFGQVETLEPDLLGPARQALLIRLRDYNGKKPKASGLY